MLLLVMFSVTRVQTTILEVVWEETFEGYDDWEFFGAEGWYYFENATTFVPEFILGDGTLRASDILSIENLNTSQALHTSTVAYGTWSFDLTLPDPSIYSFTIEFVYNSVDNYYRFDKAANLPVYLSNKTGYGLGFSNDENVFICYKGEDGHETVETTFNTTLTGNHHFDITRSTDGLFIVYVDKDKGNPIIQYTNNDTTTSKKFGLTSLAGLQIDNITVSDSVDPPPNGTDYPHIFVLFVTFSVIIILRKKREE
jgi:hypothetical protein